MAQCTTGASAPNLPAMVNFAQVSLTLNLAYTSGGTGDIQVILEWISACLNCNPNLVQVEISNPTGRLDWSDFMDAPGFGPEHPNYPDTVKTLRLIESWLSLDRKALILELVRQRSSYSANMAMYRSAHTLLETRLAELSTALAQGDLSGAQFPRVGADAQVELTSRQAQLQWVLEMLPKPGGI